MSQYNDLEEGEIEDDDPIPIIKPKQKSKTPPRQYRLHKKHHSPNMRKKKCKQFSKLSPDRRVSKQKNTHKNRNHSCSRHRIDSSILDHIFPKNITSHKLAQRSVRLKTSPAKAVLPQPKPDIPLNVTSHAQTSVIRDVDAHNLSATIQEMLAFYKRMQGSNLNKILPPPQPDRIFRGGESDLITQKVFPNFERVEYKNVEDDLRNSKFLVQNNLCGSKKVLGAKASLNDTLPDSTSRSFEKSKSSLESDDEDEEELRRIALASCLRRNNLDSNPKNSDAPRIEDSRIDERKENVSVNCLPIKNSDNYEVVDMDLEGDQSTYECDEKPNLSTSSLFIIDREPFREHDLANAAQMNGPKPNQVFNMRRDAEILPPNMRDVDKVFLKNEILPFIGETVVSDRGSFLTHSVSNASKIYHSLPHVHSKSTVSNSVTSKEKDFIFPKTHTETASSSCVPRERIVIKLTGESSTDESEEENGGKVFASLEALISSARQMSNENNTAKSNALEAVSCLSKAQQQEYNKLKKIIAQKESSTSQQKTVHSSSDDLKLLEKNLLIALSTLQKEKRFMNANRLVVAKKRKNFLRSQLAFQHIREKFLAAEKKKNVDSQLYNKSLTQFQAFQNSVTKRQTLIKDLERECKKLGTSVRGSNYKPPSITFPSLNRIRTPKRIPTGTTT